MAEGQPALVPVLARHRFDEAALDRYLRDALPGFGGLIEVRQYQGGQSNPTFHLRTHGVDYVLRKKPPCPLLPSAHAIDREFRVLAALAEGPVPVPRPRHFCADARILGTAFYVMDHVPGRVFVDRTLGTCAPAERTALYDEMGRVLALLHRIDWRAVGLADYGRPDGYVRRQVERWSSQYAAAANGDLPAMDRTAAWLRGNLPAEEEGAIVHGDYRLGNLIFHPTEPRVVAVLDWELSTLGHPLADLAYSALPWRLPPELAGIRGAETPGLPSEVAYLSAYADRTGRPLPASYEFFVVFALFRWAAIAAGVLRRARDGTAADEGAVAAGRKFRGLAERAWGIAAALG
jgi:aminoglycoside phosphotransferase (APT) family kinase protein